MGLKLYGLHVSTCTARVLAVIEELGLEYELVPLDMNAGEHKRLPYIEKNPFGLIPALEDGDLVLFESRVITRYLVRKYGKESGLLREESPADAIAIDQWIEVEAQQFNVPISSIFYQHLVIPLFYGGTTDLKVVAAEVEKLGKVLDVYEAWLSKTKFLAGDFYSLADLHHLPYVHYLFTTTPHGSLILSRPHVKAWWDAVASRPASKKVIAGLTLSL
ncbi:Glutathione S-transferase F13 [Platanthera zijinensis]|uniref:glutathione transferase n=1 Tax=Platanthera zijinensis TaxID=2320716 RepID=A0AAP0BV14_9ASPA